jgi:subtilisin family serine protease
LAIPKYGVLTPWQILIQENDAADIDANPVYPASYEAPCVLAVAATDRSDQLAWFSNFGAAGVDLGAPGVEVLSCMPGGGYQFLSGTSMATPHVAGVAALVYGRFPGIQNTQVKERILTAAAPIPALAGRCLTGGRLDAFAVLAEPDSVPPGAVLDPTVTAAGSTTLGLAWTAPGDDGSVGRASTHDLRWARRRSTRPASPPRLLSRRQSRSRARARSTSSFRRRSCCSLVGPRSRCRSRCSSCRKAPSIRG